MSRGPWTAPARQPPPNNLRAARVAAGLTQDELATRAGVARRALQKLESGEGMPTLTTAMNIAIVLGTHVEALWPHAGAAVTATLVEHEVRQALNLRTYVGRPANGGKRARLTVFGVDFDVTVPGDGAAMRVIVDTAQIREPGRVGIVQPAPPREGVNGL